MLPSSLLLLTINLLASAVSHSQPAYFPSTTSLKANSFLSANTDLCSESPVPRSTVSFPHFTYNQINQTDCSKDECLGAFQSLLKTCDPNNITITGNENIPIACGAYSFEEGTEQASAKAAPSASKTGESAASLMKISGSLMIGVAGIFVVYM